MSINNTNTEEEKGSYSSVCNKQFYSVTLQQKPNLNLRNLNERSEGRGASLVGTEMYRALDIYSVSQSHKTYNM